MSRVYIAGPMTGYPDWNRRAFALAGASLELAERCILAGCPEGGVVLDPFAGSGTSGVVANRLSRRAVLIDLNADYLRQQMSRNAQTPLGLGTY